MSDHDKRSTPRILFGIIFLLISVTVNMESMHTKKMFKIIIIRVLLFICRNPYSIKNINNIVPANITGQDKISFLLNGNFNFLSSYFLIIFKSFMIPIKPCRNCYSLNHMYLSTRNKQLNNLHINVIGHYDIN